MLNEAFPAFISNLSWSCSHYSDPILMSSLLIKVIEGWVQEDMIVHEWNTCIHIRSWFLMFNSAWFGSLGLHNHIDYVQAFLPCYLDLDWCNQYVFFTGVEALDYTWGGGRISRED